MKTPFEALTAVYGKIWAESIVRVLRAAGFIIVRHDAIRLAQAHEREACRYEAANDNVPNRCIVGASEAY